MAIELVQSESATVTLAPDQRPSSATAVLVDPQGETAQASTAAVLDTVSAKTVASVGSSPDVLVLDDVADLRVDHEYWYASANGWGAKVRVSEIDTSATQVTLEAAPPGTPEASDTLYPLELDLTVTAAATATRGRHFRLQWEVTGADGGIYHYQQSAHVVRMLYRDPVTPDEVARYGQAAHPNWARRQTYGRFREIARRANDRVKRILVSVETYPDMLGDHDAFRDAGEIAVRVELAREGLVPPGFDPGEYEHEQQRSLRRAVSEAVAGQHVDRNDDGAVQPDEIRRVHTIGLVRA